MLPFLGALLFCATALRKIKTARAHKAKALDLDLGLQGVNSGANGFPQFCITKQHPAARRHCAVPRLAVEERKRLK